MPDASVHVHGYTPTHGLHDLRQRVNRSQRAIQLSPPVVADHDPIQLVMHGEQRVFGCGDSFHPYLHFRVALPLQPLHVSIP